MPKWILLVLLFTRAFLIHGQNETEYRWSISDPILLAGPEGTFSEVSVKDPSIVHFEGLWHLFFTARSEDEYTTGYAAADNLSNLQIAPRYELEMVRGKERYGCASQVLYFEPQGKWYLLFQNRDSNYQPAYCSSGSINEPSSWTSAKPLINKDTREKWIDFWVICDELKCYLFYTEAHDRVMVRSTIIEDFPGGWGEPKEVLRGIHEAVHVYKVKGQEEYHMIYELKHGGVRSFGIAVAAHLEGPWNKKSDHYATGDQIRYANSNAWTEMISHGEAIRSGYNQRMEYEPKGCQWIIQGILKKAINRPYNLLPWKLGGMQKIE